MKGTHTRDLLWMDSLAATVAQHCPAIGRTQIAYPVRVLAEHRHQVARVSFPREIVTITDPGPKQGRPSALGEAVRKK